MEIEIITRPDFASFWPVFKAIASAQETYALDPDMDFESAYAYWCLSPQKTCVIKEDGLVLGSYYLKPNGAGPGAHIANCGYMVNPDSRGRGVGEALCLHSQKVAIELGYLAMQFNAVVSTNVAAVSCWQKLGYSIVGRVPEAFKHKTLGFVDVFVMHKTLNADCLAMPSITSDQ